MSAVSSLTASVLTLTDATSGNTKTLTADGGYWDLSAIIRFLGGAHYLIGEQGEEVVLYLSADEGDDAADQWRIRVQDGGVITLETFASSSWTIVQTWSTDGEELKPYQPVFSVQPSSEQSNIAVSSTVTVQWGTENVDKGGHFASNQFTAPVTGSYQLQVSLHLKSLDIDATTYTVNIVTSNRTYSVSQATAQLAADPSDWTVGIAVVADMDASDTAYVTVVQGGGSQQTDIDTASYFSGHLVG